MQASFQMMDYCRSCKTRTIHDVFLDKTRFGTIEEKQCQVCGSFDESEECEETGT
jgi:hypothetical protein